MPNPVEDRHNSSPNGSKNIALLCLGEKIGNVAPAEGPTSSVLYVLQLNTLGLLTLDDDAQMMMLTGELW